VCLVYPDSEVSNFANAEAESEFRSLAIPYRLLFSVGKIVKKGLSVQQPVFVLHVVAF